MEPPGQQCLFGPGVGSGYAKDPYGEVHLKELIRLQITIYIYIYIPSQYYPQSAYQWIVPTMRIRLPSCFDDTVKTP